MTDRTEATIQFQAILTAIRDQGTDIKDNTAAIRELTTSFSNEMVRTRLSQTKEGNGASWQTYLTIFSLFGLIIAPLWQEQRHLGEAIVQNRIERNVEDKDIRQAQRADMSQIRDSLSDLRHVHSNDTSEILQEITANKQKLVEVETQFTGIGDRINLEVQGFLTIQDLLQQCPTCKVPSRDYWSALNLGKGNGAAKE